MFHYLRKTFFTALYFTGVGHLLKYFNNKRYFVPILLFHRVSDIPDAYWQPLPTKAFKKIINFFTDKYTIKPLRDLFKYSPEELKGSCFIVFDDAYKDFQENALPFLKQKNIPVTMFLPVESINTGRPIWTTWLNMCIHQSISSTIKVNGTISNEYNVSDLPSKIKTADSLTRWLKSLPYPTFKSALNEIFVQTGENIKRPDIAVMTWGELTETSVDVDYQSHTMSHPMLGNIFEKQSLDFEIGDSKKVIQQELKKPVQYISYPIGSYSDAVMQTSGKYYNAGFAVDGELVDLKKVNNDDYKYKIPRFNVSDPDPYELFFRINGFHKLLRR